MAESFLASVHRRFGDGGYPGDEHGGSAGQDGSGLPEGAVGDSFMFATGIECSNPTIQHGRVRRDQLEECGHYDRYVEDIGLVRELGLQVLRYGLPLHRTWLGEGRYDWAFADLAMAEIRRRGITPILDLMHFGLPDWVGGFDNPDMPALFAAYCDAVAERYDWVRYFTPVNEIFVTARNSGRDGIWNEQGRSDAGFVAALKHATAASILGAQALANRRPDCVIVQSESAEYIHEMRAAPSDMARMANKLRFLSLDLLYARHPDAEVMLYMLDNGMTREEYAWFMVGEPPGYQVLGLDYYGRNEHIIKPNGKMAPAEDVMGWRQIAREYFDRYKKPVMHTETNTFEPDDACSWLWKQWANVLGIRSEGVPVLGFTWYSLTDQIDWDTQLAEKNGRVNGCGLYDLDRKPRPLVAEYRMLLEAFGRITIMPHAEMLKTGSGPATLKVQV